MRRRSLRIAVLATSLMVVTVLSLWTATLLRPGRSQSNRVASPCISSAAAYTCYAAYLRQVVVRANPEVALSDLRAFESQDARAADNCHILAHVIGREAFVRYGSVAVASKFGSSMCGTGYYHGLLEKYLTGMSDASLAREVPGICAEKLPSLAQLNCAHGLGHGLDLHFKGEIYQALAYCKELTGPERQECFGGVYMQNFLDDPEVPAKYVKDSDPLYPCGEAESGGEKMACYLRAPDRFSRQNHGNVAASFEICDQAEMAYISDCYQGIGRDLGRSSASTEQLIEACSQAPAARQVDCYSGIAAQNVFDDGVIRDPDNFCAAIPPVDRAVCRGVVSTVRGQKRSGLTE